eukprot:gb/GECG01016680.1/.p1 GENE.gb/GECG01016680.1/~~gb/GECG01016680.1/.p1  ORF type:complete len:221 (+),score=23.95 gb/GECG01016680.1/:1-663(+)
MYGIGPTNTGVGGPRARHVERSLVGAGSGGSAENPVAAKNSQQSTSKRKNRPALGEISANTSWKGASKPSKDVSKNQKKNAPQPLPTPTPGRTNHKNADRSRGLSLAEMHPSEWPEDELQYEDFAGGRSSSPTIRDIDKDEREYLGLDKVCREPNSPPAPRPWRSSLNDTIGEELSKMTDDDILNWDLTDLENCSNNKHKAQGQNDQHRDGGENENDLGL